MLNDLNIKNHRKKVEKKILSFYKKGIIDLLVGFKEINTHKEYGVFLPHITLIKWDTLIKNRFR